MTRHTDLMIIHHFMLSADHVGHHQFPKSQKIIRTSYHQMPTISVCYENFREVVEQPVVDSGIDLAAEIVECTTEEPPLTSAFSEFSDFPKSMSNSGRVTPASQSDVASVTSSEKSTPTRKRRSTDQAGRQIDFDNVSTSSGSIKLTKFPSRVGIHWKKGEKLEAMDFMQKW